MDRELVEMATGQVGGTTMKTSKEQGCPRGESHKGTHTPNMSLWRWPKKKRGDRQTLKDKILGEATKWGKHKNMSWWRDDRGSSVVKDRLSCAKEKRFSKLDRKPAGGKH